MGKKLVQSYKFNASTKKITIPGEYDASALLLITNVTRNEVIYSFADPTLGASTTNTNVLYTGEQVTYTASSNVVTATNTSTVLHVGSGWTITDPNLPGGSATILYTDVASRKFWIDKLASGGAVSTATFSSNEPNRINTEITLIYDTQTAGHANTDQLQIFVDGGEEAPEKFTFPDRFIDPVDKIRVSQPQSMIDTDFEYGAQPTRWETMSDTGNFPSVFPKGVGIRTNTLEWQAYAPRDERGFNILDIYSIQCGSNSKIATVHCKSGHGLNIGDFVYIVGGDDPNNTIDGHFFVQRITNLSFDIVTTGSANFNNNNATGALPDPGIGGSNNSYGSGQGFSFATSDNSMNRTSGSFITDGYRTGQIVTITSSRAGNNAKYLVTGVTALKVNFDTRNVVANETPSGYTVGVLGLAVVQSFGCYNSTELPGVSSVIGNGSTTVTVTTNVNHGLQVGQAITCQNANSAFCNGVFFIASTPTLDSFTYTTYGNVTNGSIFQAQFYIPNVLPCTIQGNGSNNIVTVTTISPSEHGFSIGNNPQVRIVNAPDKFAAVFADATVTGATTFTYNGTTTIGSGQFNAAILFQARGFVQHRPFDGGCNMTTNSTQALEGVTRQTRRYFRYQSGKGFQTSFGIRLKNTGSATAGVRIRAGHFDHQNGVFIEFDGTNTYFVRRNSTTILAGTVAVTLGSQVVNGTNTTFTDPSTGIGKLDQDREVGVVIRGMYFRVVKVVSDSQIIITPAYRGSTEIGGVTVAVRRDYRIPQQSWNLDRCDGTGPSKFDYDASKMNMVYMDWHWYGAGNVRFGFKNKSGEIFYAHKMVHSNVETAAYFRSGNLPLRYEVRNSAAAATGGTAPYLSHWGTSAILDGMFNDDRGYTFSFNNVAKTIGQIVVSGGASGSTVFDPTDNSITISGTGDFTSVSYGAAENITGPVQVGAVLVVAGAATRNNGIYQIVGVQNKKLFLAGKQVESQTASNPTLNIGRIVALANVRLAPGVENSQAGSFGGRDLQNRMQLLPIGFDIISNQAATVEVRLNSTLVGTKWQPVAFSSLAQYDASATDIIGGDIVFASSTPTPSNTTANSLQVSTYDLKAIREINNSILGGDRTYPDGPDVYTFCIKTNPSIASTTCDITFRWQEQQS